jgi:hypothetical protein
MYITQCLFGSMSIMSRYLKRFLFHINHHHDMTMLIIARIEPSTQLAPPLAVNAILDTLQVKCAACSTIVTRGQYISHWTNDCTISCFYAPACTTRITRATQLTHEQSCAHAPQLCPASSMGCHYRGSPSTITSLQRLMTADIPELTEITSLITTTRTSSTIADEQIAAGTELAARTQHMQNQLNVLMASYTRNGNGNNNIITPHRRTIVTGNPITV